MLRYLHTRYFKSTYFLSKIERKVCQFWLSFSFSFKTALFLLRHFCEIMDSPEQPSYCDLWDGTFNAMFHSANVVLGIGYRLVFHIEQIKQFGAYRSICRTMLDRFSLEFMFLDSAAENMYVPICVQWEVHLDEKEICDLRF